MDQNPTGARAQSPPPKNQAIPLEATMKAKARELRREGLQRRYPGTHPLLINQEIERLEREDLKAEEIQFRNLEIDTLDLETFLGKNQHPDLTPLGTCHKYLGELGEFLELRGRVERQKRVSPTIRAIRKEIDKLRKKARLLFAGIETADLSSPEKRRAMADCVLRIVNARAEEKRLAGLPDGYGGSNSVRAVPSDLMRMKDVLQRVDISKGTLSKAVKSGRVYSEVRREKGRRALYVSLEGTEKLKADLDYRAEALGSRRADDGLASFNRRIRGGK